MGFYSFTVFSPGEVPLEQYRILLERGPNTFNILLKEPPETFVETLVAHGVRIVAQHRLDDFEAVPLPQLTAEEISELPNELPGGNGEVVRASASQPQPTVLGERQASGALLFAQPGQAGAYRGDLPLDRHEPEAVDGDRGRAPGEGPDPEAGGQGD